MRKMSYCTLQRNFCDNVKFEAFLDFGWVENTERDRKSRIELLLEYGISLGMKLCILPNLCWTKEY